MSDQHRRGTGRGPGGRFGRGGRGPRDERPRDDRPRDDRPRTDRPRPIPYPGRPRPTFAELFRTGKPVIGVVHLKPLPGSPGYDGSFLDILDAALADARAIEEGGAAGLIVENFGDTPFYPDQVPPETIAAMTRLVTEIRKATRIPVGVNVLRNDARGGVAVAAATGAGFVRVNVHVGAMVTDQGVIMGRAFESVRLREILRSRTLLFADVRVKHALPLAKGDLPREAEDAVRRGRADALIVTGDATGAAADLEQVELIKERLPHVPVLVGSGVDMEGIEAVLEAADGCIVGTAIKEDGQIDRPVDVQRVRDLVRVADRLAPRAPAETLRPREEAPFERGPRRDEERTFERERPPRRDDDRSIERERPRRDEDRTFERERPRRDDDRSFERERPRRREVEPEVEPEETEPTVFERLSADDPFPPPPEPRTPEPPALAPVPISRSPLEWSPPEPEAPQFGRAPVKKRRR